LGGSLQALAPLPERRAQVLKVEAEALVVVVLHLTREGSATAVVHRAVIVSPVNRQNKGSASQ